MRLWVQMEYVLSVAFLIPKKIPTDPQLVGFYLSLPMGYIYIAAYFWMTTKIFTNMAKNAIYTRHNAPTPPQAR